MSLSRKSVDKEIRNQGNGGKMKQIMELSRGKFTEWK